MVGGGQMGTGIAQVAAVAGQQVSQNLKIYSNLIIQSKENCEQTN